MSGDSLPDDPDQRAGLKKVLGTSLDKMQPLRGKASGEKNNKKPKKEREPKPKEELEACLTACPTIFFNDICGCRLLAWRKKSPKTSGGPLTSQSFSCIDESQYRPAGPLPNQTKCLRLRSLAGKTRSCSADLLIYPDNKVHSVFQEPFMHA